MNPFETIPVGNNGAEVTRLGLGGVFIADGQPKSPVGAQQALDFAHPTLGPVQIVI